MKKVLLLAVLTVFVAAAADARIRNSRHNLGSSGEYVYKTSGMTQICVFCHTPHNPERNIPLWNRLGPTRANSDFQFYTASPTIASGNKISAFDSNSISLFCLSCHDGSNGLWARVKNKVTYGGEGPVTDDNINATRTNIGKGGDLTNDHPVNVRLSSARVGDTDNWYADTYVTGRGLRLFRIGTATDYVECASCHDPHRTDYGKFLRRSNRSSGICLSCHNK